MQLFFILIGSDRVLTMSASDLTQNIFKFFSPRLKKWFTVPKVWIMVFNPYSRINVNLIFFCWLFFYRHMNRIHWKKIYVQVFVAKIQEFQYEIVENLWHYLLWFLHIKLVLWKWEWSLYSKIQIRNRYGNSNSETFQTLKKKLMPKYNKLYGGVYRNVWTRLFIILICCDGEDTAKPKFCFTHTHIHTQI